MDIEFIVQDTYALTRPQWKLASDLSEAAQLFGEAVAQNYKVQEADKAPEPDDDAESSSSDDGLEEDAIPDVDEEQSSSDEVEVKYFTPMFGNSMLIYKKASGDAEQNIDSDSEEEEQIVVTRQEEERDPEAEADFDRAFEKMMAESIESRKFERKSMFDVPLPMRRTAHNATSSTEESAPVEPAESQPRNTMAFSLMTKRGNRQQVLLKYYFLYRSTQ